MQTLQMNYANINFHQECVFWNKHQVTLMLWSSFYDMETFPFYVFMFSQLKHFFTRINSSSFKFLNFVSLLGFFIYVRSILNFTKVSIILGDIVIASLPLTITSISLFQVTTPAFVQEPYLQQAVWELWGKLTPRLAEAVRCYYGRR